ncbi:SPFH domain-containing protein [Catenulispora subtropica]|uniref:Band 7 domain-containing protein n=1 Tax=Catenulispora subtropica TaxID=450798 RepID=A0ABN2S3Q7_9ACTN
MKLSVSRRSPRFYAILAAALAGLITALSLFSSFIDAWDRTDAGEIAVVRHGGWFGDRNIRSIIDPSSSLRWTGMWGVVHKYPAQQRFYTITAAANRGDRPGVDVVDTPSSDGVQMGIEGTFYFSLNLDHKVISDFDNRFGTRTFTGADGKARHAYDGDQGWSTFLDQIIRPVIDNDLREQIGDFRCADLVSSCALVQNNPNAQNQGTPANANNSNIAKIQDAINQSLEADLKATLGDDFLVNVRFNLVRITLPNDVQDAVNKAQAAYAQVSEAQARVAQAQADAAANAARQKGYEACPACAQIDIMKAIPPNVTTFAPGAGFAVTPGTPTTKPSS